MKKNQQFGSLLLMLAFVITSCGSGADKDANSSDSGNQETNTELSKEKKVPDVIYSPKGDCAYLLESLDLSSLCFTDEKVPEYEVERSQDGSCQFVLLTTTIMRFT